MARLHAERFIDAPPERVWRALTDLASYPAWNPLLVEATGELHEGGRVQVKAASPSGSGKRLGFTATVVEVLPGRRLMWKGGVRGLLHGEHFFEVTPEGTGTRFAQGEQFTGVLSLLMGAGLRRKLERAYAGMNDALAERVKRA